jgi:hypothetical protein
VTGPGPDRQRAAQGSPQGWAECGPELVILAATVLATTAGIYAYAGIDAAIIAVVCCAAGIIALLRMLVPPSTRTPPPPQRDTAGDRAQTSFLGFWRQRGIIAEAAGSRAAYDADLRPTLQHLLAARLAERHGINLYEDPAAARALLSAGRRGDELWFWLDPDRPNEISPGPRGIPPRTLAAIIDRLERM